MSTRLAGKETFFLPFNQGFNGAGEVGGACNPRNPMVILSHIYGKKVSVKSDAPFKISGGLGRIA